MRFRRQFTNKRAPQYAEAGFTIVELLIVLAIAGLILLVVFQAIPTFQRNSRNNNRKQDVANILQAVSHYELNNSGDFPPSNAFLSFIGNNSGLRYYTTGNVSLHSQTSAGANPIGYGSPNINTVDIYNYELCDSGSADVATNTGAGYGDIVGIYAIESSGGNVKRCQQL